MKDDIESILTQHPDTPEATDARRWKDMIDMVREDRQSQRSNLKQDDPKTEAEKLYVKARSYEKFGDTYTAIEQYESMQTLLESDEESPPI